MGAVNFDQEGTNVNIETLYEMQKVLDERIIREKGLEGQDLLPNTVLALQVEIGELANEWRGFKHWSNDREPRRERMLEEYVDCLHFFLSIARQLDIPADELYFHDGTLEGETATLFTELLHNVGMIEGHKFMQNFNVSGGLHNFRKFALYGAMLIFLRLGEQRLGFTWEQVAEAYIEKNRVNHERQENGY